MGTLRRALRVPVVVALAISLSVIGLYPSMVSASLTPAKSAVSAPPQKCCCGTADGACCGKACCGMVPAKNERQHQPSTPRGDDHNSVTLAISTALALRESADQQQRKAACSNAFGHLCIFTLQTQHVLLQV